METSIAGVKEDQSPTLLSEEEQEILAGPSTRCVLFELNSEIYGIKVKKIREVLRVGDIRKVEGAPKNVLGVINVRGIIVTVVDTRISYNIETKTVDDLSRIIIVELGDEIVGMMVDSVIEVKDIPEVKFEPISATKEGASKYIQAIAHFQDKVIILIDVENMFDSEAL